MVLHFHFTSSIASMAISLNATCKTHYSNSTGSSSLSLFQFCTSICAFYDLIHLQFVSLSAGKGCKYAGHSVVNKSPLHFIVTICWIFGWRGFFNYECAESIANSNTNCREEEITGGSTHCRWLYRQAEVLLPRRRCSSKVQS